MNPKLIAVAGPLEGLAFPLSGGEVIGRDPAGGADLAHRFLSMADHEPNGHDS